MGFLSRLFRRPVWYGITAMPQCIEYANRFCINAIEVGLPCWVVVYDTQHGSHAICLVEDPDDGWVWVDPSKRRGWKVRAPAERAIVDARPHPFYGPLFRGVLPEMMRGWRKECPPLPKELMDRR